MLTEARSVVSNGIFPSMMSVDSLEVPNLQNIFLHKVLMRMVMRWLFHFIFFGL